MFEAVFQVLAPINQSYQYAHQITENDILKCMTLAKKMEDVRRGFASDRKPINGDCVLFTDKYGKEYLNAHLQRPHCDRFEFAICEEPYDPFLAEILGYDDTKYLSIDASGGAWHEISTEDLKRFIFCGKKVKTFCTWGHEGAQADGAINFPVEVNIWKFKA